MLQKCAVQWQGAPVGHHRRLVTPCTAVSHNALTSDDDAIAVFYVDSGASYHIPTHGDLHNGEKFADPAEITAAIGEKLYAYSSGTLRVARSASDQKHEAEIWDINYAPEVHV
jgi:hypothetical protein